MVINPLTLCFFPVNFKLATGADKLSLSSAILRE